MKVLLTGAAGFVGHHLFEHLLVNTDWDIVVTDSFRHKGKYDRLTQVLDAHPGARSRVDIITHDLTVPFSAQTRKRMGRVNHILAVAAESHVDRSITDPVPFVTNNVSLVLSTLELARVLRPDSFLLVSTDEVYGPVLDGNEFREWAPIIPSNPYAASKAAQEALAVSYWRTYGVPVIIVNCMNMIGERQDVEKFVPKVIRALVRGEEITIHGKEGNIGTRHYLHARNLADGMLFLLRKRSPSLYHDHIPAFDVVSADIPDRYNIASPDKVDNLTLACKVAELAGMDLKWRFADFSTSRPGHDAHYGLDSTKIYNMGWSPPVPFEESLRKVVEWTLAHREWLEP
jgi:dTDP-glucose 4,6-dehydratase